MQTIPHEHDKNPITPFAVTNWRDIRNIFGIKEKNRRGHMYIIGKTGTGKSTLLANMVKSDIMQGNGLALIDPHGDLAETILSYIPQHRIKDVVYINPGDSEFPIAFNPLEDVPLAHQHLVVSGLISVFKKIWSEFWGPRLEHILRYSLYTLLSYPGATLLDLPPLLTDFGFRKQVLSYITQETIRSFWLTEFEKYSPWLRSEVTVPILNKMGQFLTNLPLRHIVGQKRNRFHIRTLMDEGKILIVNLAKGKIGEDNCSLLGAMLSTFIFLSALSRADISEDKRRSFYLYVDEFHNFLTTSFADMLSEARKYGLHLVIAHQFINQLHEKVKDSIMGNVGTLITFRTGINDAFTLAKEFYPIFNDIDIINLPNYHIYLKLMVDGVTSKPFSAITLPMPQITFSYKKEIIAHSRKQYAQLVGIVEQEQYFKRNQNTPAHPFQQKLF